MLKKIRDFVIYRNPHFFASFPAVTALPDGRLISAFRRAPNYCGMPGIPDDYVLHYDCNSQLMLSASDDGGEHWGEPELLYAPPDGASQDGGLFCSGKYLYAHSFTWGYIPGRVEEALRKADADEYLIGRRPPPDWVTAVPFGSFLFRRKLNASRWEGPFFPDPAPDGSEVLPGVPRRMHNRSNLCLGTDGSLLWGGQLFSYRDGYHSSVVLYRSVDDGLSFQYWATPAQDSGREIFEEPFLYVTPKGKYVMLIRCHRGGNDAGIRRRARLFIAESSDMGRSWTSPEDTGIHAEPAAAQRLADGRCLLVYGYRKKPYGVRARVCDPELKNIAEAEEIIIRDDGGRIDTGYPWVAPLGGNRYLVVYYNNHIKHHGAGGIEGSIMEME